MVNKKGYIKTLEAVIAIILVTVISFTLIPQSTEKEPEPPLMVQDAMRFITNKIELDEGIRTGMTSTDWDVVNDLTLIVSEYMPKNYDFTCNACKNSNTCFVETPLEKNVYVTDIFIASSEKKQDPKMIRIWIWEKPTKTGELTCGESCLNKCTWKFD